MKIYVLSYSEPYHEDTKTGCTLAYGTGTEHLKEIADRLHKGRFGQDEPLLTWMDSDDYHLCFSSVPTCEEEPTYYIEQFESDEPLPSAFLDKWYKDATWRLERRDYDPCL